MKRTLKHDKMALLYAAAFGLVALLFYRYAAPPINFLGVVLALLISGYALFSFARTAHYVSLVTSSAKKTPEDEYLDQYREGKDHFRSDPNNSSLRDCPYKITSKEASNWGLGFMHGCGQMDGLSIPDFD